MHWVFRHWFADAHIIAVDLYLQYLLSEGIKVICINTSMLLLHFKGTEIKGLPCMKFLSNVMQVEGKHLKFSKKFEMLKI